MNAFLLVFCYSTITAYSSCLAVVVKDEAACTTTINQLKLDDKNAKIKSCRPFPAPAVSQNCIGPGGCLTP